MKHWLKEITKFANVNDDTPMLTQSDSEGNSINKILCLELFDDGLTIVPWD